MWLRDKVIYTPEIITSIKGDPIEAEIDSVSVNGNYINIKLPDGTIKTVDKNLCEKVSS